ncbi:hypothetical protein [Deinococcus aquiradiocola]|uniref:Uncharacterized protein n=1 Tax=Deinococcus aquiradiocola TaxID=393059 RepID=A0A917UKY6_9DEIO|nr:hypothetical protein [Deinococcus aquiradiocola]GGJ65167.1 hypothetical protein GCM10008939_06320 [Deinococcus aquiradiocola]
MTHDPAPKDVLSLARLLTASPAAARTLQRSIERQQQQRDTQRRVIDARCPHCHTEGVVYLTLPTGQFRHRRADCCQPALRDAAEAALHSAMNPNSPADSRLEAADRYAALKGALTHPALRRELETHEHLLATSDERILPVRRGIEHKTPLN